MLYRITYEFNSGEIRQGVFESYAAGEAVVRARDLMVQGAVHTLKVEVDGGSAKPWERIDGLR